MRHSDPLNSIKNTSSESAVILSTQLVAVYARLRFCVNRTGLFRNDLFGGQHNNTSRTEYGRVFAQRPQGIPSTICERRGLGVGRSQEFRVILLTVVRRSDVVGQSKHISQILKIGYWNFNLNEVIGGWFVCFNIVDSTVLVNNTLSRWSHWTNHWLFTNDPHFNCFQMVIWNLAILTLFASISN